MNVLIHNTVNWTLLSSSTEVLSMEFFSIFWMGYEHVHWMYKSTILYVVGTSDGRVKLNYVIFLYLKISHIQRNGVKKKRTNADL